MPGAFERKMPRRPDPDLEDRILNAAQKLWQKGAEQALTMRAVAKAAGTNTPAVYRRFKNREDILRALLERFRQRVIDMLDAAPSAQEACERYLEFALENSHEYELFYHEYELFFYRGGAKKSARKNGSTKTNGSAAKQPGFQALKNKLAKGLGGAADDHTRLGLALWGLAHGTAMLLIGHTILPEYADQVRAVYRWSVEVLIREAANLSRL